MPVYTTPETVINCATSSGLLKKSLDHDDTLSLEGVDMVLSN